MSKTTDQAITGLATIAGCLETLRMTNAYARVDIRRSIDYCFTLCGDAIRDWPGFSNMRWIHEHREAFKKFIADEPDTGYASLSVVYMCAQLIEDMLDEYDYSEEKTALLTPIKTEIDKMVQFSDSDGRNFAAMDAAWHLIDNFYRLIKKDNFAKEKA